MMDKAGTAKYAPFFHDITNSRDSVSQIIMVALQFFAAKYLPYLPTEAELKHALEQEYVKVQSLLIKGANGK